MVATPPAEVWLAGADELVRLAVLDVAIQSRVVRRLIRLERNIRREMSSLGLGLGRVIK
jgi:hypothetical protein